MKTNFELSDNIALTYDTQYFDLHNNFDFMKLEQNEINKSIKLYWKKNFGYWNKENNTEMIILEHTLVSHFEIFNSQNNQGDENCLSEITFFPSTERDNISSFMNQTKPNIDDDILYFFDNGKIIRINCDEIILRIL